ncbi:MAG: phosphoenolpyruvate--protein phosphotransferase [Anaerolineaceae bacterium]|jgi:phosphotransferase system enzyme I (PtsI)|nr:phosphoenolpyruvate--protein phosphotransferase [Anaerolineaceae bacterium]
MINLEGTGASRGIAIGPVFQFRRIKLVVSPREVTDIEAEIHRLNDAIDLAEEQLKQVHEKAIKEAAASEAEIFEAHLMMLRDPELWGLVESSVQAEGINVEQALVNVTSTFTEMLKVMDDEYFAARALDVQDVSDRVLRILLGVAESPTADLNEPSIIFADDLTPSDTILLDKSLVLGFCTAEGSATSHSAILARGLGLPAVAGAGRAVLEIENGTPLVMDGSKGLLLLNPDEDTVRVYRERAALVKMVRENALKQAAEPAITADGREVEVGANIGNVEDAHSAVENGADGVGLLRTEFLYLERASLPTEDEQYDAYQAIMDVMGKRPLVLRTLDAGGDKEIVYLDMPKEMNPFLGERAIRLCFAHPELLKTQLRAALRASVGHNLKIMFPMIATLDEVRRARAILEECQAELLAEGKEVAEDIEVGIMVEIPAAAVMADQLAKEVDFFSIGTNDLSQYTLAADRTNARVAHLSNAFQPAVLRLVRDVVRAAHAYDKWAGMCGELAGEPLAVPLLIGLGLDEFSMSPPMVPLVKQIIRGLDAEDMRGLATEALNLESPEAIKALVKSRVPLANVEM